MDYKAASINGLTLLAAEGGASTTTPGLPVPNDGQTLKLRVEPGDIILLGFDPNLVVAILRNGELLLIFQNGGRIVLENFVAASAADGATAILLPSGITVAGDVLVAQLAEEGANLPLETAAGDAVQPPPVSSGGGLIEAPPSGLTLGEVVELIEALVVGGVLPSTAIGFISTRQTTELQIASANNILVVTDAGGADTGVAAGPLQVPPVAVSAANRPESPFGSDPTTTTTFGRTDLGGTTDGNDEITGTSADEVLRGGLGDDTLSGAGGDDFLDGGPGADLLDGGDGRDIAAYSGSLAAVTVSLADGTGAGGDAEGDTLTSIEILTGSGFDDTLIGDEADNTLQGNLGADTLDGRGGSDTASYSGFQVAVTVNLEEDSVGGGAADDQLISIENIIGTDFDDTLIGDGGDNRLNGLGGADTLQGGAGADTLTGGTGNDLLFGNEGDDVFIGGTHFIGGIDDDTIVGGPGTDTLDYSIVFVTLDEEFSQPNPEGVFVDLLFGIATGGRIGTDTISEIEIVIGGSDDDLMLGDDGLSTTFDGGPGLDTYSVSLSQFAASIDLQSGIAQGTNIGTDVIRNFENATGGTVGDTIRGTADANELRGLAGADVLTGRGGADDFLYSVGDGGATLTLADIITDFEDGADRIMLLDGLVFGAAAGQAQFVAANSLGLGGAADDTAFVITDGAGGVTEVLAVIDSVAVGALDQNDVVTA